MNTQPPMSAQHLWLNGGTRARRQEIARSLELPPSLLSAPVDAHRRLRGPYTMAGTLVERLAPRALTVDPDLVQRHDIELLSVSIALSRLIPATRQTLTSLAVPAERTRFYSPMRTLRLSHGLVEFVRDHAGPAGIPGTLHIENVEHADPTDIELLMVMVRRLDPARLMLVLGSGTEVELPPPLADTLGAWATRIDVPPAGPEEQHAATRPVSGPKETAEARAAAFVAGDCVSDDPALTQAYATLSTPARAALHDRRADELDRLGEQACRLGALPFHREHGSDPVGAAPAALRSAMDYCIDMGFYHATIDLAERGRALTTWDAAQADDRWAFTTKLTTSLAALGRAPEAEALYNEVRAVATSPQVLMQAAYATAMLYTRHHAPEARDNATAKGWINKAIALASANPDPQQRAFQTAFNRNGLALIEVHSGNLPKALEIVNDCLALLDRELGPADHRLHRSVLLYNRGQVNAGLGRLQDAVADYDAVIAEDPNYAEYYLDRGTLRRRLGDALGALSDYETAIRLSPPFPEVYYNRADTRASLGDIDAAIADFGYVIELDPTNVDAIVNRAGLLTQVGSVEQASHDIDAGLALAPDNAHLHCIQGQLAALNGDGATARDAFGTALQLDPGLLEAWVGRASLSFDQGDADAALADLDQALSVHDNAVARFNRAAALQAAGRWADALTDLDRALELEPGDEDVLAARADVLGHLAEV